MAADFRIFPEPDIDTAAHWRTKAAESRRIADQLSLIAKKHMLAAADSYDRLATLLEKATAFAQP
jgi:hypothetical protein